jgi:hypothetical protein
MEWCISQFKMVDSFTNYQSMIILLHKRHEKKLLFSWHLVMLLNIKYKIFAKAFEIPLQFVLMQIITTIQLTFLPLKYI